MKKLITKVKLTRFFLIRKLAKNYPIVMNVEISNGPYKYTVGSENSLIKPRFGNDLGLIANCFFINKLSPLDDVPEGMNAWDIPVRKA